MSDKRRRSWIVVPVSRPDLLEQAQTSGADVIVLDLVEFVADRDKPRARDGVRAAIERVEPRCEVFVQTTPSSLALDLHAAVTRGLRGVVMSRIETREQIAELDSILSQLERERGLAGGELEIVAAVETARGNHNAYDIARASKRVGAMTLGRADLTMDLRAEPSGEIHLMEYLMQRLILVSRAAHVTPIGAWWRAPDRGMFASAPNTYAAAERGRAIGFVGAMCVQADQVEALNRAFEAGYA